MKILALQHVPFEGVGLLAEWAQLRGHALSIFKPFLPGADFNALGEFDMVIPLGGPMSVHDEASLPWLAAEKKLLREALAQQKYVLGVCLGAQLIADVMGAKVSKNPVPEIGWLPIAIRDEAISHPLLGGLNPAMTVFHWHGETFALPPGAQLLMSSAACEHQAFMVGTRVLGLQFHLEMTEARVRDIIPHGRASLIPSATVQSEQQLLEGCTNIPACRTALFSILDRFTA